MCTLKYHKTRNKPCKVWIQHTTSHLQKEMCLVFSPESRKSQLNIQLLEIYSRNLSKSEKVKTVIFDFQKIHHQAQHANYSNNCNFMIETANRYFILTYYWKRKFKKKKSQNKTNQRKLDEILFVQFHQHMYQPLTKGSKEMIMIRLY